MIGFSLGPTSLTKVGETIGLGCQNCALLELCGGTFSEFDCLAKCCNNPTSCTVACPRSDNFVEVLQDAGGLHAMRHWNIAQVASQLPVYIPLVHNGSGRSRPLTSSYVAFTTFDVVSPETKRVFSDPCDLRKRFQVCGDAQVLLPSIGKDIRLEQYWQWSAARQFARYLAALGVAHITAPNFSFPLDVPRPEHLVNRMRSLKCAEQLSAAGLSVIPHVNAFNQKDWECWQELLRDHAHIRLVAQEFQTGLATRKKASWHIRQLCNVEQSLGRGLHLAAVGGRRHLPLLVGLPRVTVVDSVPFMRACMRRLLDQENGKRVITLTPPGEPVDDLLEKNMIAYHAAMIARIRELRRLGPLVPESKHTTSDRSGTLSPTLLPISAGQLQLWPMLPNGLHNRATPTHS